MNQVRLKITIVELILRVINLEIKTKIHKYFYYILIIHFVFEYHALAVSMNLRSNSAVPKIHECTQRHLQHFLGEKEWYYNVELHIEDFSRDDFS